MKKLLFIGALALNLAACSNDSNENINPSASVVDVQESTFNPNPNPEDYRAAKHEKFLEIEKSILEKDLTKKTAAVWVRTYVPDANFRQALLNLAAAEDDAVSGDNYILIDQSRGGLQISGKNISDLTGIKAFTNLVQLLCSDNELVSIDVSGMVNLRWIECHRNHLTNLNLSTNINLEQVWCHTNGIKTLSLPASNGKLFGLWAYSNKLQTLNLNGNITLSELFIQTNDLTSLNFVPFTALQQTNLSSNQWETLNFTQNKNLRMLYIESCSKLIDIDLRNQNNRKITNQSFYNNKFGTIIHVDPDFLEIAREYWKNHGTSTYAL